MNKQIFIIILLLHCSLLNSQSTKYSTISHNGNSFDLFMIKIDSLLSQNITIHPTLGATSEFDLYDSLSKIGTFFAINAGSVDSFCNLLGLQISQNKTLKNINYSKNGSGNFFSFENGILAGDKSGFDIYPTKDFDTTKNHQFALQSGPILIIEDKINPAFSVSSKNKFYRCGVGITVDSLGFGKELIFVKSNQEVSFFEIASLFYHELNCKKALNLESGYFASMFTPKNQVKYSNRKVICNYLYISIF